MIRDVDETVRGWLAGLLEGVDITFDPPGAWVDPGSAPTLSLHLYDVREDSSSSTAAWDDIRNAEGVLVGRYPPLRRYRFTFLVTAFAGDTLMEHGLLGDVLVATAGDAYVPDPYLAGCLVDMRGCVMVRCAPDRGVDTHELWVAWRIPPRTALELTLLVPMPTAMIEVAGSPPSHIDLRTGNGGPAQAPSGNGARADAAPSSPLPRPTSRIQEG